MSWAGLKKATARATTSVMMKTGQVEKTNDAEFQREDQMYRTLEKNSNALQKEAKAYLDSVRQVSASSTRIAGTLDLFFGSDAGESAMSANAYKRATEEMEGAVARDIDAPYRATVMDPIGKLCSHWPEVNKTIEKRNKKLIDYDAARSKAKKLSDKPSDDPTKLRIAEQEAETAKEIFEVLDQQVRNDLPQLLDLRVPYLDPSFECMVRVQAHFASDGYEKLGGVQRYFADTVRDDYASGQLDAQVEGCLQEMRELSICGLNA
ncbi:BZ3500_MvSof-1268-A1-R1_Chr5-2g08091 [Microbotryum saponariae]|uniref:BZ3500_MvSof-1268-A1-R1_Chr5-2g08091 protein n=1 Tax=Microbotryum saponariae TaxID=289078 RepID=A0A2X0LL33_9BASI|nr:BZ3500_MvSof-1268-A1-R1_Chr5-2g08091 [Microbotryum saponariae]SDA05960.1 BZ3501_MvSof-1269-A2-R1_Chr5-2g07913 [Microbotryum saponariae]